MRDIRRPIESLLPLDAGVARHLRVPLRWLRAEIEADRIPALVINGRTLINIDAVEAALIARASHLPKKRGNDR